MIWAYNLQPKILCTHSMISFACVLLVVTCRWFGFNAIIVTHLLELTFEFAITPIVKENKLRSRVMCQPGVMKQILDGCCWLICGFDDFKPTSGWIYHCECKQRVCFGWCLSCQWNQQIHTDHDSGIQCQILLFWEGVAHISCVFATSLSFDILDKWNIDNQRSTSCVRPGHVMVFLIVFSVLVCPG
jgi:hypothetical protein